MGGGKCVRIIEEEADINCGDKQHYDAGWCVETVKEKAQEYCEKGYEMDKKSKKCIATESVSPDYSCKGGELGRDGTCHSKATSSIMAYVSKKKKLNLKNIVLMILLFYLLKSTVNLVTSPTTIVKLLILRNPRRLVLKDILTMGSSAHATMKF